jgi:transposase InsO family protein
MAPKAVMTLTDWRLEVLLEPERSGKTVKEVCERHEISRDTFYRWRRRFEAVGIAGLLERSTAPICSPRRIRAELEDLICAMRREHPRWGARTISARLKRAGIDPPAISTIHRTLRRNGFVVGQPRKKPKSFLKRFERPCPNDLWQMDATEIELTDGTKTQVLSIIDDHARFCLAAVACPVVTGEVAWSAFAAAASTHGVPRQLLSDNDIALTGRLRGIVVDFERKLRAAGVHYINGAPYHPQTQGKVERFHQTLQDWIEDAGGGANLVALQAIIDAFRDDYNGERPHQAIGDATPAERYRPSHAVLAPFIRRALAIGDPDYPPGSIVRKVYSDGTISFDYLRIALGREWAGRRVRVVTDGPRLRILYGEDPIRILVPDRTQRHQPLPYQPPRKRLG